MWQPERFQGKAHRTSFLGRSPAPFNAQIGNRQEKEVIDGEHDSSRQCSMDWLAEFDLLTLAEVAKLLHCSKAHICNAVAGRVSGCPPIPAVSLGRRKLVRRASLLSWIESNEHPASPAKIESPERGRKNA